MKSDSSRPNTFLKRMLFWRNDVDGKAAADQGRSRFHGDETTSDDGNTGARDRH